MILILPILHTVVSWVRSGGIGVLFLTLACNYNFPLCQIPYLLFTAVVGPLVEIFNPDLHTHVRM